MEIKMSRESFSQSAKALSKVLDEKFGKQGRGGLAWASDALARALKFESTHAAHQFLERPDPCSQGLADFAARVESSASNTAMGAGFASLPMEERLWAFDQVLVAHMGRSGHSPHGERARQLMAVAVEYEEAVFKHWQSLGPSASPSRRNGSHAHSVRQLLAVEVLVDAWKMELCRREKEAGKTMSDWKPEIALPPASLAGYFKHLPYFDHGIVCAERQAVAIHNEAATIVAAALARAEKMESCFGLAIMPARGMAILHTSANRLLGRLGSIAAGEEFKGTWLDRDSVGRFFYEETEKKKKTLGQVLPKATSLWDIFVYTLSIHVEVRRITDIAMLGDICDMPQTHRKAIAAKIEVGIDVILAQEASAAMRRLAEDALG